MVSLVEFDSNQKGASPLPAGRSGRSPQPTQDQLESAAMSVDNVEMCTAADDTASEASTSQQEDAPTRLKRLQQQKQLQLGRQASSDALIGGRVSMEPPELLGCGGAGGGVDQDIMMDDMDEEQLKRILACKRLSEGCNRFNVANLVCRKNSLHMLGESLAPVTEGEPMRHMSHHMSQNIESTSSSSVSSASFRSGLLGSRHALAGTGPILKRNSQDDNTTSCSSSTSLDGVGPRSPSRRRSSTVSQCSSVLSEGTRQQLNFDLSPDLPPDTSILEANAISPTDFDRPASPEPSSLGSGDNSFDMRPISRMSAFCDDVMPAASPDSTLGDSNQDNSNPADIDEGQEKVGGGDDDDELSGRLNGNQADDSETRSHNETIRDNLERIISHVSTVKVSSTDRPSDGRHNDANNNNNSNNNEQTPHANGQKRAHTPFGANLQRNKSSLISSTPSPNLQ